MADATPDAAQPAAPMNEEQETAEQSVKRPAAGM